MVIQTKTFHEIVKYLLSLVLGLLIFVCIHVWDKNERQDQDINNFRIEVAREYVAKKDFERFEDRIGKKLELINRNVLAIIKGE
mgnify:CR=1 FL=1